MALRDCGHCQAFVYREDGEHQGKPAERRGQLIPRKRSTPPPCRTKVGCPRGTPENDRGLSEKNRRAYHHHLECDAVGRWPDDPLVRRNARVIREALAAARKKLRDRDERRRRQGKRRTPGGDPG